MKTTNKKRVFSTQTRNNIILDMALLISALVSVLSGIYFLFLPVGGFQGGRNLYYGINIIFERHAWSDIHIWASVIIIGLAALHIPIHWQWIVKMTKTGFRSLFGKSKLNKFSRFNLAINVLIGISGLICGLSGVYFLLVPAALGSAAGAPVWIFSPLVWDLIHTWSGVVMTAVGILHFGIHWKWVVKVLNKYWKALVENNHVKQWDQNLRTPIVSADDNL